MSSPRNPTYFNGDLRSRLLEEAAAAVAEYGPVHVSLREVARRVGVSHAAPKNHFADKRALFTAVATEAHRRLRTYLDAADAPPPGPPDPPDPLARLVEVGQGYLRFAREQPAWYAVMWQEDMQDRQDTELLEASRATFELLLTAAATAVEPDGDEQEVLDLAVVAWSFVHGLADLTGSGALRDLSPDRDTAQEQQRLLQQFRSLLVSSSSS